MRTKPGARATEGATKAAVDRSRPPEMMGMMMVAVGMERVGSLIKLAGDIQAVCERASGGLLPKWETHAPWPKKLKPCVSVHQEVLLPKWETHAPWPKKFKPCVSVHQEVLLPKWETHTPYIIHLKVDQNRINTLYMTRSWRSFC